MVTGDCVFSLPDKRSIACSRWKNALCAALTDLETTYSVPLTGSMTGVPVTPTSGVMSPSPSPTR
jgi:hypothetical protein